MKNAYWHNGKIMHIWPQKEIDIGILNGINQWFYENGTREYVEQWIKSRLNGPKICFKYIKHK